jgi:hypothetical protein
MLPKVTLGQRAAPPILSSPLTAKQSFAEQATCGDRCGEYREHVDGDRVASLQFRDDRFTRWLCCLDRINAATIVVNHIDAIRTVYLYDPCHEHAAVGGDRIRIVRALSYGRSGSRCCWRVRIPDGERHVTGVVDADKVTLFDTGKANTRSRYHGDWGLTFGDNRQRFRRRINGLDSTLRCKANAVRDDILPLAEPVQQLSLQA